MTRVATDPPTSDQEQPGWRDRVGQLARTILIRRELMLAILLVVMLVVMFSLDRAGMMLGHYNLQYMMGSLISVVPLAMLALAELLVILTGRGSIDLSVGSIVSLVSMIFGFSYGLWGVPLLPAIVIAILAGGVLGAVNGVLVAYFGFPALMATLATYYAYWSLAIVINGQQPINSPAIQDLYGTARSVPIPGLGEVLPPVPFGVVLFLLPTVVVVWYVLNRAPYGRRLYATGTNDVAARWSGIDINWARMRAFVLSGMISGLVAVVTVGQFASARPDAGNSGNGMALPAITIAVLGGVAITGGIGRVGGVILAALLVVWLQAGILLLVPGNQGTQFQLLALGVVLVLAALVNGYTNRRFGAIT